MMAALGVKLNCNAAVKCAKRQGGVMTCMKYHNSYNSLMSPEKNKLDPSNTNKL